MKITLPPLPVRLLALLFAGTLTAPSAGSPVDFLVVEDPSALVIYNQYEQSTDLLEKRAFQPFKPILILADDTLLSDSFTRCMRVRLDGQLFYLIRNQEGELRNRDAAGLVHFFRDCRNEERSLRVLVNKTLFLSKLPTFKSSPGARKYFLEEGDHLQQHFRRGDFAYVRKSGEQPDYGWTYLAPNRKGRFWEELGPEMRQAMMLEEIAPRIGAELEEVNELLRRLYSELSQETGRLLEPPSWRSRMEKEALLVDLQGAELATYARTGEYLLNRLQNLMLGTGLTVTRGETLFVISANGSVSRQGGSQR